METLLYLCLLTEEQLRFDARARSGTFSPVGWMPFRSGVHVFSPPNLRRGARGWEARIF